MSSSTTPTSFPSLDAVVAEITRSHRSLPLRPAPDDHEAADALSANVDKELDARHDAISRQKKPPDCPDELFAVLQEMQRALATFQAREQKQEAARVLELERIHARFDDLIQRASRCLPGGGGGGASAPGSASSYGNNNGGAGEVFSPAHSGFSESATSVSAASTFGFGFGFGDSSSSLPGGPASPTIVAASRAVVAGGGGGSRSDRFARDDSYLKPSKPNLFRDGFAAHSDGTTAGARNLSSLNATLRGFAAASSAAASEDAEKLSLIKLASIIEVCSKKGTRELILQGKLMDQIGWLPDSIGKLSILTTLDLSENRITALPNTIGGLSSLTKLDLHSNRIAELPESIGNLISLEYLNLRANQISSVPPTFGKLQRLVELDLSSNCLLFIPDVIGNLCSLKRLDVETNDVEELPHTIGNMTSLVELRADYNRLKALPEAVGRLQSLEILSVRYNNIKSLPTTMASLANLKEINVSFNELESVPESLCLATTLVKLNISNNFADLRYLPRSIGNLEQLEELDISNNQIRVLPDSFSMLAALRVLHAEENPLEVPPRHIADMGARAVVEYMADHVGKKDNPSQPARGKKSWTQLCWFSRPNKRKHDGLVT